MSISHLLSLAFFTLAFASNSIAQNPYYPMERGSEIHYKYAAPFATSDDQYAVVSVLDDKKEINGKSYYVVQTKLVTDGNETVMENSYLRFEKNGSLVGIVVGGDDKETVHFPAQPYKVGTSWINEKNGVTGTSTIKDLNGSIDTPNGKFDHCLVVEAIISGGTTIAYLQEGIGLVALSIVAEGQNLLMMYVSE